VGRVLYQWQNIHLACLRGRLRPANRLPLPQVPAIGAIIVELGGGMMLVVGWNARWAAAVIFVFTALAGLLFHNFWAVPAAEASNQMTHFLKNVCILGGLLYVVVHGSGPLSIEGLTAVRSAVVTKAAPESPECCAPPRP